jgi:YHS domain-containing protein
MWLWDGLANALRMAWEVWWALVLGFALSGIVQAWVPRTQLQSALGGRGAREAALATGLGAASSSCSYAAIAIAKSLFEKGASLGSAMAFQFASTNLVFELGIVLWLFIGWRFTLAEFVGGLVLIAVMWIALRVLVSREREEEIRTIAAGADAGHVHPTASSELPLRRKLLSVQAWSDVAHNFRGDWQMLWKEIGAGFLIAGYIALLPMDFFNKLFVTDAPGPVRIAENVLVGPIVAALAFVCSIGNVPLAAVLWAGGISFSGVVAFLFADLLIPPIVAYYRKVYGGQFAALLVAVMGGSVVLAALAVDGLFSLVGLVPSHRPSVDSIAERPVTWNYTSVLDIVFGLVFVALIGLTLRRGAIDPVCGMTVDRHAGKPTSVYGGKTWFFCGDHCKHRFDEEPERFSSRSRGAASGHPTSHA